MSNQRYESFVRVGQWVAKKIHPGRFEHMAVLTEPPVDLEHFIDPNTNTIDSRVFSDCFAEAVLMRIWKFKTYTEHPILNNTLFQAANELAKAFGEKITKTITNLEASGNIGIPILYGVTGGFSAKAGYQAETYRDRRSAAIATTTLKINRISVALQVQANNVIKRVSRNNHGYNDFEAYLAEYVKPILLQIGNEIVNYLNTESIREKYSFVTNSFPGIINATADSIINYLSQEYVSETNLNVLLRKGVYSPVTDTKLKDKYNPNEAPIFIYKVRENHLLWKNIKHNMTCSINSDGSARLIHRLYPNNPILQSQQIPISYSQTPQSVQAGRSPQTPAPSYQASYVVYIPPSATPKAPTNYYSQPNPHTTFQNISNQVPQALSPMPAPSYQASWVVSTPPSATPKAPTNYSGQVPETNVPKKSQRG